jgi:hypothetical protein
MSKTKMLSKHNIVVFVIVLVIIFGIYWYMMNTKENFSSSVTNNKDLKNALNLASQLNLPDNILSSISSVPTLTQKLPFSSVKESFYGMGPNTINSFANAKSITNTSSWNNPNLTYSSSNKKGKGINQILNRPPQPIPLPEGELDMFATTKFKPQCCPNTYSNSTGCACMTTKQYKYLIDRGGNNVPYSEY